MCTFKNIRISQYRSIDTDVRHVSSIFVNLYLIISFEQTKSIAILKFQWILPKQIESITTKMAQVAYHLNEYRQLHEVSIHVHRIY